MRKHFWTGLIGLVVIASYIAWLDFFFGPMRKAIARGVGNRIGAKVSESDDLPDAGTWQLETEKGTSFLGVVYTHVLAGVTDIIVLLAGAVLPVAAAASALFLCFNQCERRTCVGGVTCLRFRLV